MEVETMGQINDLLRVPLADKLSLSPEQASELSGVGLTRIREAIADRTLVAHKHGTRTLVLPDDLKAWLKSFPLAGDEKKDRP
jgi:excisionase family DNA binding protein